MTYAKVFFLLCFLGFHSSFCGIFSANLNSLLIYLLLGILSGVGLSVVL